MLALAFGVSGVLWALLALMTLLLGWEIVAIVLGVIAAVNLILTFIILVHDLTIPED